MKTFLFSLFCFISHIINAQNITWTDSINKITLYFHIDESQLKNHPHRTSKAFEVIETSPNNHAIIQSVFQKTISKYPKSIVDQNKDKFYVYDQYIEGNGMMGTYLGRHGFFFTIPYLDNGQVDTIDFERLIHHEFSHRIFIFNIKHFAFKNWKTNNKFKYGDIKSYDRKLNSDLYPKGFLHKYAVLNKWEDFASFAEFILMNNKAFWKALTNNQLLRNKFEIICSFYEALNPTFDRDYILKLNNISLVEIDHK